YAEIALNRLVLDSRGRHLYNLAQQADISLHVYSIANALQVPTLAFCIEDKTLTYSAHFDVAQALTEGLARVVQHLQSRLADQLVYDLPAVPQLSLAGRADLGPLPASPATSEWRKGLDWLLKTFQHQRWHALAFPLDHDPALCSILPFLVRVLLVR